MDVKKIREDFPVLQRKISGKPIVYFDNACMTLKPRQVVQAMNEYYENYSACVGRSIHKLGNEASEKYENARKTIAKFIGAKNEKEIIFTRNTTEGINLLANSLSLKKGDVVLASDREHNSNLIPWQILVKNKGIERRIVKSKPDETFDIEGFKNMMNNNVKLVSIVHSSNLDGYTLPVKEIVDIAKDNKALVMLDAAQSVPHKEVNVRKLGVDFLVFSGHKMLGPTGTGVLYGRYGLLENLNPFMVGGDTVERTTYDSFRLLPPPEKFEAGLQNYASMMGLAEAARYLDMVGRDNIEKHENELNKFITGEMQGMGGLKIIGVQDPELRGGIISFEIDGIEYHDVAIMLDDHSNVMVRSGQHCVHSWFNARNTPGSVRASLYLYNTKEDAETFIEALKEIIKLR
jgi:cysteine desulfurase/selenocysteine lyase